MPTLPNFSTATFESSTSIDNPYFPLTPGTQFDYEAEIVDPDTGNVERENNRVFVTGDRKTILGVDSVVVRDTAWTDDQLVETTFDWFAQDQTGNVWYMGELSINYEYNDDGKLIDINTNSSWEAGVDGALPGFIMPADPQVGDNYYQEFAFENAAIDDGTIFALDQTISTASGDYENVLVVRDSSGLEPDFQELKYYAPGIGQVLVEEGVDESFENPEATFNLLRMETIPLDVPPVGTRFDDVLVGDELNNKLLGKRGNDLIEGNEGRDRLFGQAGNDLLMGGTGNDRLVGGFGDDILIGGIGEDRLRGGKGDDQFVFTSIAEGVDRILDFDPDRDVLGLSEIFESTAYSGDALLENYVSLTQRGQSTIVSIDPDGDLGNSDFQAIAILKNVNPADLSAESFVF